LVEELIMSNVWILTTGSSDVQLTSNSDWHDWSAEIKKSMYNLSFVPVRSIDEDSQPYRLPARVLSTAYEQLPEQVQPHLTFPLLANFIDILREDDIQIDHIVVLVSDQKNIFSEDDRQQIHSPYWQDTCTIYPIIERCLQDYFFSATIRSLSLRLQPSETKRGLDDWDAVLGLVQTVFQDLKLPPESQNIYVSHQAGTPAISSAVQFTSLSIFGERVKFLVSNERDSALTKILDSSSYLKGIRKKESQKLLERHDYLGVQSLIGEKELATENNQEIKILLEAAIQWNYAEFDKFKDTLINIDNESLQSKVSEYSNHWSWRAYEEIYLAEIRRDQGNIVEAFFHSFRAFEGAFAAWGHNEFGNHIENPQGIPYLIPTVLNDPKEYFSSQKCKNVSDLKKIKGNLEKLELKSPSEIEKGDKTELNLATLCKLFKACRYDEYKKDCKELKIFWESDKEKSISEKRNLIVHQIQGMPESKLWEYWDVSSKEAWWQRLLKFLNFISNKNSFESLQDASLMSKVHERLKVAIDHW
jgi:hypothetical protein